MLLSYTVVETISVMGLIEELFFFEELFLTEIIVLLIVLD